MDKKSTDPYFVNPWILTTGGLGVRYEYYGRVYAGQA